MARGYVPPANDAERIFLKRVEDLVFQVQQNGIAKNTLFCNDREQALALQALAVAGWTAYRFDGGYLGAERCMLCIFDAYEQPAPLTALRICVKAPPESLTHRDYLGALMALGIKRECIGDIVLKDGDATLFVSDAVAQLIENELREVGRYRAEPVRIDAESFVPPERAEAEMQSATVASLRLDSVLAAMLKTSRSEAASLIGAKAVQVNHVETTSVHYDVYENDVFTIRGRGKYKLCRVGNKSRKDRTFVFFIQY